jgi:hypothetical protein
MGAKADGAEEVGCGGLVCSRKKGMNSPIGTEPLTIRIASNPFARIGC